MSVLAGMLGDVSAIAATSGGRDARRIAQAVAAFLIVGATITVLGVNGGAYDIVVRQRFALVLWWVIAMGAVAGVLPRGRPARSGGVVLAALVLMGLWTAASLAWTSSDERTLTEIARVGAHLGVVVLIASAAGPTTWRPALAGASAAAVAICAIALGSRLDPSLFGTDVVAHAFGTNRLSYPLGYWNATGAWAGMTTVLCLGWSAHARSALARGLTLAAVPLALVVAYLTYSRASLAGGAFGILVLLAVSRNRWTAVAHAIIGGAGGVGAVLVVRGVHPIADGTGTAGAGKVALAVLAAGLIAGCLGAATGVLGMDRVRLSRRAARRCRMTVGPIAAVGLVIASIAVLPGAWRSFTTNYQPTTSTDPAARFTNLNSGRYLIYKAALQAFEAHPLDGTGAGTFEFTWNLRGPNGEFLVDGHSLYLEPLSEMGIPGLAWVVLLVIGVVAALWRGLRAATDVVDRGALAAASAAIGAFFLGAGVDWLWESTAVAVLMLTLVGCAIAAGIRPRPPPRLVGRAALAACALVVCALQLPGLISTSDVRKSQAALNRGDLSTARTHADDAISAEPWAATPVVQRALLEEHVGEFRAARSDLLQAESRERENWRIPLILARVDTERGHALEALADYRRARSLRPHDDFFTG